MLLWSPTRLRTIENKVRVFPFLEREWREQLAKNNPIRVITFYILAYLLPA